MKTKTLLLVCLIIGIGFTRVSAQKPVVQYTSDYVLSEPVLLDGELFWLTPDVEFGSYVDIYDHNGDLRKGITQIRAKLTNVETGEIIAIHIVYKGDYIDGYVTEHYNFKGNMDTHYIARLIWDVLANWEFTFTKMISN